MSQNIFEDNQHFTLNLESDQEPLQAMELWLMFSHPSPRERELQH